MSDVKKIGSVMCPICGHLNSVNFDGLPMITPDKSLPIECEWKCLNCGSSFNAKIIVENGEIIPLDRQVDLEVGISEANILGETRRSYF